MRKISERNTQIIRAYLLDAKSMREIGAGQVEPITHERVRQILSANGIYSLVPKAHVPAVRPEKVDRVKTVCPEFFERVPAQEAEAGREGVLKCSECDEFFSESDLSIHMIESH